MDDGPRAVRSVRPHSGTAYALRLRLAGENDAAGTGIRRKGAPPRAATVTVDDVDESLGAPAPELSTAELGDELSVFHAGTGDALSLNRTAADVFALADGSTTVEEAVRVLSRAYGVPAEDIAADVADAVRLLRDAGVLVAERE